MPYRDDDNDELDDAEYSDEEDGDEEDDTVECPYCRASIYGDAVRCPRCENYLSREDAPSRTPLWIVLTALICLVVVLAWVFGKL